MIGKKIPKLPRFDMRDSLRVACIQYGSSHSIEANLKALDQLALQAVHQKAEFITFPENFAWRGKSADISKVAAQSSEIIKHFQCFARKHGVHMLLGSLLEKVPGSKKCSNTSLLLGSNGKILKKYRKIHLFKVNLSKVRVDESKNVLPGHKVQVVQMGKYSVGLSICYDLRFPELYRRFAKMKVHIVTVPANFTDVTGKAHWETLIRARAIENQVFVVAPAQIGKSPGGHFLSHGNSLIVDPWGKILARGSRHKAQVLLANLDFKAQAGLRKKFPVLNHRVLKDR